ncbi:MAG TPA: GNAT family N-acetyltransferase [Burkholderiaceae bacterium]|jgi:GNAT superfamily N-acetyltransferase|nr:GNAT family N-acetyltransferase [Burkholderiaceae bacterium]
MRNAICPTYLHFHDLASHYLALTASDRFLRFGWVLTDVDIVAYVENLFRSIGNVFVVVEPAPDISGALHLEFGGGGADLGLSVSAWARGKGIGTLLLERAGLLARARGASTLFVRNLNFNTALQRLAHRVGIRIACAPSARSTRLELPAGNPRAARCDPFAGSITLADHSLRSHWVSATAAAQTSQPECMQRVPM